MLERLPEFAGNHPVLSLAFIGLVLALIFTEISRLSRGFKNLSPGQLTQLINRNDAVVIDVSAKTDFDRGHIVNAHHILPSQIDPASKPLKDWTDRPLAVYCKNGITSVQVCKQLQKAGFSQVHMLQGGLTAWLGEQLPVTRSK
ncbi:MAG: rhodanese-like domain-containing protein [Xanthomonadales bacterium]|nr:rhodanese-like domain-containing protein [Xanthomonadales bacterium]